MLDQLEGNSIGILCVRFIERNQLHCYGLCECLRSYCRWCCCYISLMPIEARSGVILHGGSEHLIVIAALFLLVVICIVQLCILLFLLLAYALRLFVIGVFSYSISSTTSPVSAFFYTN